jgi:hypothetical protein
MKIPFFGKPQYQAPQVASVPEGQTSMNSGTFINEKERQIVVKIFDDGSPAALAIALGTLEVAKDIVKHQLTAWHDKERRVKGIIQVQGNGHG